MPDVHGLENIEELLLRARGGSSDALGRLLNECRQYLQMVANRRLDSELHRKLGPSDVVQETLHDAQRDFDRFHGFGEVELLAWLRRILLNNLSDATRYWTAGKRQVGREVALRPGSLNGLLGNDSPSSDAAARERDAALQQTLEKLPEPGKSDRSGTSPPPIAMGAPWPSG